MLRSSGSATHAVVSGRANTMSATKRRMTSVPSPRPVKSSLADEDVGSGRGGVADPDQLGVRRIVCDEVRLEHADRPSVEQHEVVVGRVGALDRREIVRHHVLVRPPLGVPAADVRALEPFVEQPEVVGHHQPERELGGQSHESRIG